MTRCHMFSIVMRISSTIEYILKKGEKGNEMAVPTYMAS